ncbi:MAG: hypothetical protein ACI39G_04750 [Pseudoramibacter sp.]
MDSDEKHDTAEWLDAVRNWLMSIYAGLLAQGYKMHEIDGMDICRYGEVMHFVKETREQEEKQKEIDEENAKKERLIKRLG